MIKNIFSCDREGDVVSEFELQLRYYVIFRTNVFENGMKTIIHVKQWIPIVTLLFFYKDGRGI